MKILVMFMCFLLSYNKDFEIDYDIYLNIVDQIVKQVGVDTLIILNESDIFNPINCNKFYFDSLLKSQLNSEFKNDFNKNKDINFMIGPTALSEKFKIFWEEKSNFDKIFHNQELELYQKWDLFYSRYSNQYNVILLSNPFFNKKKDKVAIFVTQLNYGNGSGAFYYFTLKKNKWTFNRIKIVYKS